MSNVTKKNVKETAMPTPSDLKRDYSITEEHQKFIHNSRETVKKILQGEDKRLLLIVGPCSIHDIPAAKEYAAKLKTLSNEVERNFFILMRTYFEKPRTTLGWKGLLFDPHLNGTNDIQLGLQTTRKFLIHLAEENIAAATEFLDPNSSQYYSDLITWGCIGSRTAESQTHRELASAMDMAIGFKNNTNGNVQVAINGILAASEPHAMISINGNGLVTRKNSEGNPHCHLVLRGGDTETNYDPESISQALNALKSTKIPERLVIDCSHGNSKRQYQNQLSVFQSVLHQYIEGNSNIRGMILESNLREGHQSLSPTSNNLTYGVSITDACLNWNQTEQLIRWGSQKLEQYHQDPSNEGLHASTLHENN